MQAEGRKLKKNKSGNNEIEKRKTKEKNQWNQKVILWKDQQNDKFLARLTKKKEEIQITRIRYKGENITTDLTE